MEGRHLRELLDYVSVLDIEQSRLEGLLSNDQLELGEEDTELVAGTIERIRGASRNIRKLIREARFIGIGDIAMDIPMYVARQCRKLSKKASCIIKGSSEMIDRTYLEDLDIMIRHILDGVIATSIEDPQSRVENGKVGSGLITLSFNSEGDGFSIEIKDDGRGCDFVEDVHGIEEILLKNNALMKIDDAGRGYNRVVFSFPAIDSMVSTVVIRVGGEKFAFSASMVEEVVKGLSMNDISDRYEYAYNGRTIPVLHLGSIVKSSNPGEFAEGIVISSGAHTALILVDEVLGRINCISKPINGITMKIDGIEGMSIIDGNICGLLDSNHYVNMAVKKSKKTQQQTERQIETELTAEG